MTTAARLAVLLLAHHDDEVFCAGRLRHAQAAGADVRLLWATAGGLAPARRRIAEGVRVGSLLGLDGTACRDLRLRDQRAAEHVDVIAREALRMIDDAAPGLVATILVAAYEGGHPDHDAVNLAASLVRAVRPAMEVLEYPLYRRGSFGLTVQSPDPAAATPAEPPFEVLGLDDDDLALRRELARANASQLAPSLAPLLAFARWAGRGRAEPARPLPAHDYSRPPHLGRLLYELYTPWRFPTWAAATSSGVLRFQRLHA